MKRKPRYIFQPLVIGLLVLVLGPAGNHARAQTVQPKETKPPDTEKAELILQRSVEALGGSAYLGVRSLIGRGLFTQYRDGQSGIPSAFVDYIVYPDRERTEFKNPDGKIIQTNTGDTGWLYDGAAKSIKEMTKAQVDDFKRAMRSSVDYVLRGFWRKEGATLSYVGRREAGLAKRNEVVRLTYTDGFTVDFEFGAKDYLPMKALYKRANADGEEVSEEDRMAQHLKIAGVTVPFVIDHYSMGAQTSRINYQSIEMNLPIADTLFARPANLKAVK
ncbi:MAG TPA: hypothetical protein VM095_14610 [Pyrinomonadaceae bacterium]|nr:hypothetical protein [Pyrinomonadaceae bacterium]